MADEKPDCPVCKTCGKPMDDLVAMEKCLRGGTLTWDVRKDRSRRKPRPS